MQYLEPSFGKKRLYFAQIEFPECNPPGGEKSYAMIEDLGLFSSVGFSHRSPIWLNQSLPNVLEFVVIMLNEDPIQFG
jgi:hypothetical protein